MWRLLAVSDRSGERLEGMTKLDEMKEQIDLYDEIYPIEINIVETLIQIAEAAFELSEMFLPHGAGGKLYVLVDRIQELKKELENG